jgi:IS30 family transposase
VKGSGESVARQTASVKQKQALTFFKTMAFDDGTEGANRLVLREEHGIAAYHCDAFASWQKGGVENANGVIRKFLPKLKDLPVLNDLEIHAIQETINDTPRKSLDYLAPNEAARQYLTVVVR